MTLLLHPARLGAPAAVAALAMTDPDRTGLSPHAPARLFSRHAEAAAQRLGHTRPRPLVEA